MYLSKLINLLNLMEALYEKNTNGNILVIRHGQTYYNQNEPLFTKYEVNTNPDLLDSELNELGKQQAEEAQPILNQFKVKYAFSSPLMRCLQTTYLALLKHPQRDDIVVIVHPLITETVNGVHDYIVDLEGKKKLYNMQSEVKFDWSYFDDYFPDPKVREVYFLEFVNNYEPGEQAVEDLKRDLLAGSTKENLTKFAKYFQDVGRRPETLKAMFNRGLKFKEFLRGLLKDVKFEENEKVLIFTHSSFIMVLNSEMAYTLDEFEDFPGDCYKPKNLEILSINITK
jgi:broad specificity phosphatase PhoE